MRVFAILLGFAILATGLIIFIISHLSAQDYKYKKGEQDNYNKWKKRRNIGLIIFAIGLAIFIIVMASDGVFDDSSSSGSSSGGSARCVICDTRYSDSDNVKSINRSDMCKQCYKNYKYSSGS